MSRSALLVFGVSWSLSCAAPASHPVGEVSVPPAAPAPPAPTPEAKYGPALDASTIPPGKGWHCFGQSVSLRCSRELAACEALLAKTRAEDEADGEPTVTTDGCLALERAWCMTVERTDGSKKLSCFTNETTCAEDGSFYRNQARDVAEGGEVPEGMVYAKKASGCAALE